MNFDTYIHLCNYYLFAVDRFFQPSVLGSQWWTFCHYRFFLESPLLKLSSKLNLCIPSDPTIWLLEIYSRGTLAHAHRKQAHKYPLISLLFAVPIPTLHCSCCLGVLPLTLSFLLFFLCFSFNFGPFFMSLFLVAWSLLLSFFLF